MNKWINAVTEIAKNENAVKIEMEYAELRILTARQICVMDTGKTKRYYQIPACRIFFKLRDDGAVVLEFYEYRYSESREGFWGQQIHPHISNNGRACWGNIEGDVQTAIIEEDYYTAWLLAVEFLRSVNVYDVAGMAICHWDEVDKEGNILRAGHEIGINEYGEGVNIKEALRQYAGLVEYNGELYDEDDLISCESCGEYFPEEYMTELDSCWFCQTCIDDYFTECDVCGGLVEIEYGHIVEGGEKFICEDCFQNHATLCEACEDWVIDEDMVEIDGMQCCSSCASEATECEVCGELTFDPRQAEDMTVCYECLCDYEASGGSPIRMDSKRDVDERLQTEQLHLERCVICGELKPREDTVDFCGFRICKKCEEEYNEMED